MDKIKIKFKDAENNWKYQLRIPVNLEWFEICRYYKTGEKDMYIHIYVYEKIICDCYAYYNIKNKKLGIVLKEEEKEDLIKQTTWDLINSLGINKFTLEILNKLNVKIPKKHNFKNMFRKKENYLLSKNINNDNYKYDIIEQTDKKVIGNCNLKNGNLNLLVWPNCQINFENFLTNVYGEKQFIKTKR